MGGHRGDTPAPASSAGRAPASSDAAASGGGRTADGLSWNAPAGGDAWANDASGGTAAGGTAAGGNSSGLTRQDTGGAGAAELTADRMEGLLAGAPLNGQPDHRAVVMALVFKAGPLYCALPLEEVVETMRPLQTRPLAGTPPYVRGLTILRGAPAPVIDVTLLITGAAGEIDRYIAVRAGRGPIACATGVVLGVRQIEVEPPEGPAAIFTGVSKALIAGVGSIGTDPLLLLRGIRTVPDDVWEAAGAAMEAVS